MSKYSRDKISNEGFTLIEIVIVFALIAVLSGILFSLINVGPLLARGRDARRLSDLDSLNKAINLALLDGELTLQDTSTCSTCSSSTGTISVDGTGYVKFAIPMGKTGLSKFLTALPIDPVNQDTHVFTFGSSTTGFEIHAILESPDNAAKMSTDGGDEQYIYEIGTDLDIL